MTSFSLPVYVSHGQYLLHGLDADLDDAPYGGGNGLVWVNEEGDGAIVMTGMIDGELTVAVDLLDSEPATDLAAWDDVVEVTMTVPDTAMWIRGPESTEGEIALPEAPAGQGSFRVRVHVRGRDQSREEQYSEARDGSAEEHLILIWSAPPAPEIGWKLTDEVGAEVRARE
jgi:hypothetical protein